MRIRRRSEPRPVGPRPQDAIVTSRLLLRPVVRGDADAYADLIDDTIVRNNGLREHHAQEVHRAIRRGLLAHEHVMETFDDGRIVGMITRHKPSQFFPDSCEIGFWVGAEYRGRGFASEAVGRFVSHLHTCGFEVVEAGTAVDNHVVRRLLIRTGFVAVEEYRRTSPNGVVLDAVRFHHVQADRAVG